MSKKVFKVVRPFTLNGKIVKVGDLIDGTIQQFSTLIQKGKIELTDKQPEAKPTDEAEAKPKAKAKAKPADEEK